jgi:hypothetical protein
MSTPNTSIDYANDGERITQPGKFEGQPIFAPHFWSLALEGFADNDDGKTFAFKFQHREQPGKQCAEFTEWPTLKAWLGRKRTLRLSEDSQGFVHCY